MSGCTRSEPELENEDWLPEPEMSPQFDVSRRGMIFRLASKRAADFADVDDLCAQTDVDELPTRRYSTFWRIIQLALISTRILSVEEQPTLEVPIAERSTLIAAINSPLR